MKITVKQLKQLIKEQVGEAVGELEVGQEVSLEKGKGAYHAWEIFFVPARKAFKVVMTDEYSGGEEVTTRDYNKALKIAKMGPSGDPGEFSIG